MWLQDSSLKFSVENLKSKFYHTFNCIYFKPNAANSQVVTEEYMKSYCLGLPDLLYATEASSLTVIGTTWKVVWTSTTVICEQKYLICVVNCF